MILEEHLGARWQSRIDLAAREEAIATALAIVAGVAALAGGAIGAVSSIQQGEAAEKSAQFNAAVERNNAQIATDQARYQADRVRRRNLLLLGTQRAGYAKAGVTSGGTPEDVMFDSSTEGELDALAALYSGRVNSASLAARARLTESEGANLKSASQISAGASLLGGISQGASLYATSSSRSRSRATDPDF